MVNKVNRNDYYIASPRTDLYWEKENVKYNYEDKKYSIYVSEFKKNDIFYRTIHFSNLINLEEIKKVLKKELSFCLNYFNLSNDFHIFIVGLGNDNHTADSVGPKTLKHIKANSYLEKMGVSLNSYKISALEPGVLGETGIETKRIIESVVKEIKPDLIILIDSYIVSNINYLNKTIQITNEGVIPGSGFNSINSTIDYKTLGIPILVIGVPTAIEARFNSKEENLFPYFLSTKDIDTYVLQVSSLIGESINEVLYHI